MRVITEEVLAGKLIELRSRPQTIHLSEAFDLLEDLIEECTELNPFYPIDENTPKDKFLLLYSPGIEGVSKKFVGKLESCWYWNPTHWQELPEDPK